MPDIWIRAYGGTGNLMARAFINCMMMAPLKDKDSKITIFLMDYDEAVVDGNDNSEIQNLSQFYNNLRDMKLPGIATNEIQLVTGKLNIVRQKTFGIAPGAAETYSLKSLFGNEKADILRCCLNTDQIEVPNSQGAYGDLARNSVIAKPMETNGFFNETYNGFNPAADSIVFYLGSTDGGVANTILDRDLSAFCKYIKTKGHPLDDNRKYKIYSVRTLPYKKHSTDSIDPDVKANAQRILSQMVAQSMGVVDNINGKEDYVHIGGNPNDYKLDALFVAGYNVANSAMFNDTNNYHGNPPQAHIDNQSHFSHGVELISALMMIDAINNPELGLQKGTKAIYGYNAEIDPANPNKTLTSKDLFNSEKTDIPVEPDPVNEPPIQLDLGQKIKVAVHLYAFLLQFQKDLTKISNDGVLPAGTFKKLFNSMYNVGFLMGGGTVNFPQIGRMSAKFSNYINAGRELTRFVYEIQKNTLFDKANPVIDILPQTALENLINDPGNPDFNFSLGELYIKGDDNSYNTIVTLLQRLKGVLHTVVTSNTTGDRDDDEATAILINLIYQQIYEQLSLNGAI